MRPKVLVKKKPDRVRFKISFQKMLKLKKKSAWFDPVGMVHKLAVGVRKHVA